MSTRNFVPRGNQEGGIGTALKQWLNGFFKFLKISSDIVFTPITDPSYEEGKVFYDSQHKCLSYYNENNNVKVCIGQENILRVKNETGSTIQNGTPVRITGANGDTTALVAPAQANNLTNSKVFGVTTSEILNNEYGYATVYGELHDIDTSIFNVGDRLYLSDSVLGGLTTTLPSIEVFIAYVLKSHETDGEILIVTSESFQSQGDMLKSVYDTDDDGIVDSSFSQSHEYAESDSESSTTSTDFQTKTTLTFTPPSTGDYIIEWTFELNASTINRRILAKVDIDDTTIISGQIGESSTLSPHPNGWILCSGFKKVNLSNSSKSIKIKFATEIGTSTAYIRNARILTRRVH
jgi:hypothetical protein